jgi:uncharacterized protein with FMN-binding domain
MILMMARIGNKLIAICSAAIGIIYTAGYVVTESPAAVSAIPIEAPETSVQASTAPQINIPTPTPEPVTQNQKYQDGTYSGAGTNRFGTVEVEVTILKGKIAKVDITSSRTRYPQKYIDPLPDEVLAAQDYNIDTISGATRSSEDFINAVHEALTQAEGNN